MKSLGWGSFNSQQSFQVKTGMWCWQNISVKRDFFFFNEGLSQGRWFWDRTAWFPLENLRLSESLPAFHHHLVELSATQDILEKLAKVPKLRLRSAWYYFPAAFLGEVPQWSCFRAPVWFVSRGQVSVQAKKKKTPITFSIFNKTILPSFVSPSTPPQKKKQTNFLKHIWTLFL